MSWWRHLRTPLTMQYPPAIAIGALVVVLQWADCAVSGTLRPSMEVGNSAMETYASFLFAAGRASGPR